MKKTILPILMFIGISLSTFAEDSIPASFPRKFLMEQFTGKTCGNCPNGVLAIYEVFRLNPDKYI